MPEPIRVLLVEDSDSDARLVREVLFEGACHRFDLERRGSLAGAAEALEVAPVDVVLLDLGLPDAEGLDGLLSLHALYPDLPIIVLTGRDDGEDVGAEAVRLGAEEYLSKANIHHRMLCRILRYAVERHARMAAEARLAALEAEHRAKEALLQASFRVASSALEELGKVLLGEAAHGVATTA